MGWKKRRDTAGALLFIFILKSPSSSFYIPSFKDCKDTHHYLLVTFRNVWNIGRFFFKAAAAAWKFGSLPEGT